MKAAVLVEPGKIEIEERPIPPLKKGEVLVKMSHAPINPSDLSFIRGNYGLKKDLPVVVGLEGSGVVVDASAGVMGKWLTGKRVACAANVDGTWATYMVTTATRCLPLPSAVNSEQGSMLFVNPLTAMAFITKAKSIKADALLMNAAGSSLAKMVVALAHEQNLKVIGTVRSEKAHEMAISYGFDEVISQDNYDSIRSAVGNFRKVLFLDAVGGGEQPQKTLACLPKGSCMLVYGRLLLEQAKYEPSSYLFNDYTMEGFWLSNVLAQKSLLETILDARKATKFLKNGFTTKIRSTIPIDELLTALDSYQNQMSGGKILLKF